MKQTFTLDASAFLDFDPRIWNDDMKRVELAVAEHAIAAYLAPRFYSEAVKSAGFVDGRILEHKSAQVAVTWCRHTIIVAARGSSEKGDWVDDFGSVVRVRWSPPLPRSHTFLDRRLGGPRTARVAIGWGFRRQAAGIGPDLITLLRQLLVPYSEARIVVTGHSLGAALVRPLVALLYDHVIPVKLAIAFEEPRVGNRAWAEWYQETFDTVDEDPVRQVTPSWSVINVVKGEPDIVTRLPRRNMGFRHAVPRRRVIHAGGQVLFGPEAWQRYRAAHPVPWWRPVTRLSRSVRAHLGQQLLETLRGSAGSTVYGLPAAVA